jgi:uncharacterized protein YaiL (DUF2058 family)
MATQIKGTNQEFLEILRGLEAIKGVKGKSFSLLVARNIASLAEHLKPIESIAAPSKEFNEVAAIAHSHAENEDSDAIKALEEEHKDLIEERKKQLEQVEEMLSADSKVKVNLISEEIVPEEVTAEQLLPLLKILKD